MSEFIERRRELSVKEYEFMKHLKLFTEQEIREIKNKRFEHEHKVERHTKELPDFIKYIVYETNLLELIYERRRKLRIRDGKHSLESSIHHRIKGLYKRALVRFASKLQLWEHFLKHCERYGFGADGSRALDTMLNYHGDKPSAWISAANWEYKQMHNMEKARHFMFRGLQRHPECREMYLNFLLLQVGEIVKITSSKDEIVKQLLEQEDSTLNKLLQSNEMIYSHYSRKSEDLEFFVEIIRNLKNVDVCRNFTETVMKDMKECFATNETMWHSYAQLALDGCQLLEEEKLLNTLSNIEKCIKVYNIAVKTVPTQEMWTYYIDAMLELNKDMTTEKKLRRKMLGAAFRQAFENGLLCENKYIQYVKLLMHSNQNETESFIFDVLNKALESFPSSVELWKIRLTCLIHNDAPLEEIERCFKSATTQCKDNALPLWTVRFQYYHARQENRMEHVFREALSQSPSISNHFQPLFLEYLVIAETVTAARKEYRNIQRNYTPCLALHKKMAQLESIQAQPDIEQWRLCHENATQYFGSSDAKVWIDYIKFERDHGRPKHMQLLFERAKSRLKADLISDFITEYELLKTPLV